MKNQITKIKGDVKPFNQFKQYKVGQVVLYDGNHYISRTGKKAVPGDGDDWIFLGDKVDKINVNVKDYGAKGDAVWDIGLEKFVGTDDTAAIQAALDSGFDVYIPEGKYLFTSNFTAQSNQTIFGKHRDKSLLLFDGVINGSAETYFDGFDIYNQENITIKSLGFRDGKNTSYQELLTFSEACTCIKIFGESTRNIKVLDCSFKYIHGHGVYDGSESSFNTFMYNYGEACGQNVLNINSKYPTIHYNIGCYSGFGLLEASCGNGSIQFNEAFMNEKNGITIGGFAGPISSGYGSNNLISNNKCYLNKDIGIHLSAHCVDSIISNNIVYQNDNIGISTAEPNDITSNLLITNNKVFDNGLDGESTRVGIYISSKGCTITNNQIYNTGISGYSTHTGIGVDYQKHGQIIKDNEFEDISNWEISIQENNKVDLKVNPTDRVEFLGVVELVNHVFKVGIGYNGQPITNIQNWVWVDNASSPKTAVLPDATKYPEGQLLYLVDEKGAASTNSGIFQVVSGQKINGVTDATVVLDTNYQVIVLTNIRATANWIIVSNTNP